MEGPPCLPFWTQGFTALIYPVGWLSQSSRFTGEKTMVAHRIKCLAEGQGLLWRRKGLDGSPGVQMPCPCLVSALGCLRQ